MYQAVILAGGLATRMHPLTKSTPKALLEVAGQPFIFHQLRYLAEQGIENVILCVGYLGNLIEDAVGDGRRFGIQIRYSYDGDTLLGTAGAIKIAYRYLDENFFVLYGDSYLPIDYESVQGAYVSGKKPALMTVFRNMNNLDTSNVIFKNGELLKYDKERHSSDMDYIDYGLGVLSKAIINKLPSDKFCDLAEVYRDLSIQRKLSGLEIFERFYEIGSPQGMRDAETFLKEKNRDIQ